MNLSELGKEQKQYIALGAIAAVIMLALLFFGIRFILTSSTEAKAEFEALTSKIEKSDRTLAKRSASSLKYDESVARLKLFLEKTPPTRNYYSWATEIIYAVARNTELEVDAVDETGAGHGKSSSSKDVALESYALRITAHGGYENAKQFLSTIQHENPLVRVTGIEINKGKSPEVHDIQLNLEWPFNFNDLSAVWESIEKKKTKAGMRTVVRPEVRAEPEEIVSADPVEQPVVVAVKEEPEQAPVAAVDIPVVESAAPVIEPVVAVPEISTPVITPAPAVQAVAEEPDLSNVKATQNATNITANKLENLLHDQSQKDEKSWNKFMNTLQGDGNE